MLACPLTVLAAPLCPNYAQFGDPATRWQEGDFTQESAAQSLALLQDVVENNAAYSSAEMANAQSRITGYIYRREALIAIDELDENESRIVSKFCQFLLHTIKI